MKESRARKRAGEGGRLWFKWASEVGVAALDQPSSCGFDQTGATTRQARFPPLLALLAHCPLASAVLCLTDAGVCPFGLGSAAVSGCWCSTVSWRCCALAVPPSPLYCF